MILELEKQFKPECSQQNCSFRKKNEKGDAKYCSSVACYHMITYGRRGTDQKVKCLWCWKVWPVLRTFSIFFLNKGQIFPPDFERHTTGCFTCWKVCPLLRSIWCSKAGISVSTFLTGFSKLASKAELLFQSIRRYKHLVKPQRRALLQRHIFQSVLVQVQVQQDSWHQDLSQTSHLMNIFAGDGF